MWFVKGFAITPHGNERSDVEHTPRMAKQAHN